MGKGTDSEAGRIRGTETGIAVAPSSTEGSLVADAGRSRARSAVVYWRAIDRSQDAGGQRPRPGRVNRRTPSVDRTNEGRREEVSVGSKGRLSMDYARNARTGNASIAGTRRLARSADKVAAPHDAARRATASRDRSARRVARTVQESPEVDLPSSRDRSHRGRRRNPGHIPGRDRQHDAGQRVRRCRRADRPC